MKQKFLKYYFYEKAVQNPSWSLNILPAFQKKWTGKKPFVFREDFCGSALLATQWVMKSARHSALAIDYSKECEAASKALHYLSLSSSQKRRFQFLHMDLIKDSVSEKLKVEDYKADWIGSFNYSVFEIHERAKLKKYFESVIHALNSKGMMSVEIAGGDLFLTSSLRSEIYKDSQLSFEHFWEQKKYDPLNSRGQFAIHFKDLRSNRDLKNAFEYDWRVWSPVELKEIALEVGFIKVGFLWPKAENSSQYVFKNKALNYRYYNAFLVAQRS